MSRNGSCVEHTWENFREMVFASIERLVPHKILKEKNQDPEYYNMEEKRLKVKVRRTYKRKKLGEHFQADLKRISRQLLANEESQYCKTKVNAGQSSTSM